MTDFVYDSLLSEEQIEENFKEVDFFEELMNGLSKVLAFEKGSAKAETYARKRSLPEIDVAKERKAFNMTQKAFAALIGVSKRTVESWESGACTPSPTAKKLIYLLSVDSSLVDKLQNQIS